MSDVLELLRDAERETYARFLASPTKEREREWHFARDLWMCELEARGAAQGRLQVVLVRCSDSLPYVTPAEATL